MQRLAWQPTRHEKSESERKHREREREVERGVMERGVWLLALEMSQGWRQQLGPATFALQEAAAAHSSQMFMQLDKWILIAMKQWIASSDNKKKISSAAKWIYAASLIFP